jgi:hypothetical protein
MEYSVAASDGATKAGIASKRRHYTVLHLFRVGVFPGDACNNLELVPTPMADFSITICLVTLAQTALWPSRAQASSLSVRFKSYK